MCWRIVLLNVRSLAEQEALRPSGLHQVKVRDDEVLHRFRAAIGKADRDRIGGAFVASLVSKPLVYRSALRSYAMGRHMPRAEFVRTVVP